MATQNTNVTAIPAVLQISAAGEGCLACMAAAGVNCLGPLLVMIYHAAWINAAQPGTAACLAGHSRKSAFATWMAAQCQHGRKGMCLTLSFVTRSADGLTHERRQSVTAACI